MNVYDIFFSICLGLFIGGILMSIISLILAEMTSHDSGHADHIDHVDHVDHIDHVDHVDHIDHVDQVDHIDHVDHVDHIDHVDQVDHIDHVDQVDHVDDTTPAPFMLLFSTSLLIFGITGMLTTYIEIEEIRFLAFIITPISAFLVSKLISIGWKRMAKSRYYAISSTMNLIGKQGEVVLAVDNRGGVIKVRSNIPQKFEKMHVRPLRPNSEFTEGRMVYICDVMDGFLLVDEDKKLVRKYNVR
ncbi:MAG: DUF1449 family protein [Candidatus Lokiarchaeota archaeon]|nr:DUF1449 family protein [Candidatus Lokiarchaeota archaeon]